MNENQTNLKVVRPTRAQKALLDYVASFITENGYSPSYREIQAGMNYGSLASVATHVDSLVKRGHLIKRDKSARSLELTRPVEQTKISSNQVAPSEEKWLVEKVEHAFNQVEAEASSTAEASFDHLFVLVGALRILGLEGAAQSFMPRLTALKEKATS
jgi:SOS-response transcriptional repressor LexA